MIRKLLAALVSVIASVCVATIIAEAILASYYARTWQLDRAKLTQMLAIARGADLEALLGRPSGSQEATSAEQVSYSQVVDARAVKTRNLELREQALRNGVQQLQSEQRRLAEERQRLQQLREGFQGELLALEKGAAAKGREDIVRTLETLKPKQAKELMLQMLDAKELDDVVTIVASMSESKRAKVIAEFKLPTEAEQIGEVLRRIRQGIPTTAMAENTAKQLEPPKGPGP